MAAPGRKKGPAPRPAAKDRAPSRPTPARTAPVPASPAAPSELPRNGLGTTALVLGIAGVVGAPTLTFGVLLGVPALVVGFLALQRVRRGQATNRRSAITAMVLGVVAVAIVVGLIVYGRVLLNSPAGKRYTACLDRAGDDRAAKDVCEQTWDRER